MLFLGFYNITVYRKIVNPESPSVTSFDRNNGSNRKKQKLGTGRKAIFADCLPRSFGRPQKLFCPQYIFV